MVCALKAAEVYCIYFVCVTVSESCSLLLFVTVVAAVAFMVVIVATVVVAQCVIVGCCLCCCCCCVCVCVCVCVQITVCWDRRFPNHQCRNSFDISCANLDLPSSVFLCVDVYQKMALHEFSVLY